MVEYQCKTAKKIRQCSHLCMEYTGTQLVDIQPISLAQHNTTGRHEHRPHTLCSPSRNTCGPQHAVGIISLPCLMIATELPQRHVVQGLGYALHSFQPGTLSLFQRILPSNGETCAHGHWQPSLTNSKSTAPAQSLCREYAAETAQIGS